MNHWDATWYMASVARLDCIASSGHTQCIILYYTILYYTILYYTHTNAFHVRGVWVWVWVCVMTNTVSRVGFLWKTKICHNEIQCLSSNTENRRPGRVRIYSCITLRVYSCVNSCLRGVKQLKCCLLLGNVHGDDKIR